MGRRYHALAPVVKAKAATARVPEWKNGCTSYLSTPNAKPGVTESMNDILDYVADLLLYRNRAVLQIAIVRFLNEAPMQCPHSLEYNPELETLLSNRTYEAGHNRGLHWRVGILGCLVAATVVGGSDPASFDIVLAVAKTEKTEGGASHACHHWIRAERI